MSSTPADDLELVVFDLGGTTIEDDGHVPTAFEEALGSHGVAVTRAEIARWRGASKREILRRVVGDEAAAEQVYGAFQDRLIDLFRNHGVRPIVGIEQAWSRLRDAGLRIALTTGFDRRITDEILASLQPAPVFDAVVCGDDVAMGRPAPYMIFRAMEQAGVPSVHRVANVGDTINDLRAGHAAGVAINIGVLSGAHDRATLSRGPHTHLLASATQVPEALF